MRLGRSAEYGPLSQKNGLVCVSQNWRTEQKPDQKSTPEQAPSIEGGGPRPTRDAPDPTTADAPDAGANGVRDSGILQRARPIRVFAANPRQNGSSVLFPAAQRKYLFVTCCSICSLGAMEGFAMVDTYDAVFIPLHVER